MTAAKFHVTQAVGHVIPQDWMTDGLCNGDDADERPDAWFPEHAKTKTKDAVTRHAIHICGRCPVAGECLTYAITYPGPVLFGIWAGTTESERRPAWRRHRGLPDGSHRRTTRRP